METFERLVKLVPDVKAIVSSGYSNDSIMADYKKHGFANVIAKPYLMSDISLVVNSVINGKGR